MGSAVVRSPKIHTVLAIAFNKINFYTKKTRIKNNCNHLSSPANLSLIAGTSQVSNSQAIFGYLNLVFSLSSIDGSLVVNATSSSITVGFNKLKITFAYIYKLLSDEGVHLQIN